MMHRPGRSASPSHALARVLLAAIVWLGVAGARSVAAEPAAAPLRVAVVLQPNIFGPNAAVSPGLTLLKGYVLASLARAPGVEVLSPERVDLISSQFATLTYDVDAAAVARHLAAAARFDAMVYLAVVDDKTVVTIVRGEAVSQCELKSDAAPPAESPAKPAPDAAPDEAPGAVPAAEPVAAPEAAPAPRDRGERFAAAGAFIRTTLHLLPDADAPKPGPPPAFGEPDVFMTYNALVGMPPYLTIGEEILLRQTTTLKTGSNLPLAYLAPVIKAGPPSPELAARYLGAIYAARADLPRDFPTQADDIAASLRIALGTPFESAAYPFLSVPVGAPFEPVLQTMCIPLSPAKKEAAAVDELFDSAMQVKDGKDHLPKADLVSPTKKAGPVSRAASLGALRALGCMQTPTAAETLVDAAANKEAAVREAAAVGLGRQTNDATKKALVALAGDAEPSVALAAGLGLFRRGAAPQALLPSLRRAPDSLFAASPLAAAAMGRLATADDRPRLVQFARSLHGPGRTHAVEGLVRLGGITPTEIAPWLLDDESDVILAALSALAGRPLPTELAPAAKRLANDPDAKIAEAAYKLLAAGIAPGSDAERLLRLECGSTYDRLSILTGISARRDIKPSAATVALAATNSHALIRFEALRLTAEHYPDRLIPLVRAGLADPNRWVRIEAANLAVDRAMPEIADALKAALARETHPCIRPHLAAALAKATGAPPPPMPAPAPSITADNLYPWTSSIPDTDIGYAPFEGVVCYFASAQAHVAALAVRPMAAICRVLWGLLPEPESLVRSQRSFDDLWNNFDADVPNAGMANISGFDLRVLGLGTDWAGSWPDFCRDAHIDPARIAGDVEKLSAYERRAYDFWALERGISGFTLMNDLLKLRYRFVRPNVQIGMWSKGLGIFAREVEIPLERWKFDMAWGRALTSEREWAWYSQARISRTLWPDRGFVYDAPVPGGIPSDWVQFTSPMPSTFIYKSEHDAFTHTLLAWAAGAHIRLACYWRFIDYKTKAEGLYTPGVNMAVTDVGPSPTLLEKGLEHTFKDAPLNGPADATLDPAAAEAAKMVLEDVKDPAAGRKNTIRVGVRLMQKHLYDCARIYASLPPLKAKPDVLLVQGGLSPLSSLGSASAPPVIAARELPDAFDLLPGVNLLPGRDLSRYRLIILHNGALLRDETIRALTQWLRETPGLLVVHQDLTSDKTAQASTPTEHSGLLTESWPWEADMAIRPAAETPLSIANITLGDRLPRRDGRAGGVGGRRGGGCALARPGLQGGRALRRAAGAVQALRRSAGRGDQRVRGQRRRPNRARHGGREADRDRAIPRRREPRLRRFHQDADEAPRRRPHDRRGRPRRRTRHELGHRRQSRLLQPIPRLHALAGRAGRPCLHQGRAGRRWAAAAEPRRDPDRGPRDREGRAPGRQAARTAALRLQLGLRRREGRRDDLQEFGRSDACLCPLRGAGHRHGNEMTGPRMRCGPAPTLRRTP
ncbi:MAG: hypothetical protein NTW19_17000 [Planctomycetota bacterium]|nr:hypothetical protein [Planctomycetota bacterium]